MDRMNRAYEDLRRVVEQNQAENRLLMLFSADEVEQIKEAALARAHRSVGSNHTVYIDGLEIAYAMALDNGSLDEILKTLTG